MPFGGLTKDDVSKMIAAAFEGQKKTINENIVKVISKEFEDVNKNVAAQFEEFETKTTTTFETIKGELENSLTAGSGTPPPEGEGEGEGEPTSMSETDFTVK